MTVYDDFQGKGDGKGLQVEEMVRIIFMALMTLLKRRFPAQYTELVDWWGNQS